MSLSARMLSPRILSAALPLLGLVSATAVGPVDYTPFHKRHSYGEVDDFTFLSLLSKRDTCAEAFGKGSENEHCNPSLTLCCTLGLMPHDHGLADVQTWILSCRWGR